MLISTQIPRFARDKVKARMHPVSNQILGDLLVVVWSDGHESYYPLEQLRRGCPVRNMRG
jgi:hypothetical protein